MERVHDFDSHEQFLNVGCFEAGQSVHRDDVDAFTPVFRSCFQPLLKFLFRPSGQHVEQACRARFLADGSEVDDDGDVLVTAPGVPPYVFVDTDDADPVEPGRFLDQQSMFLREERGVRSVPGHGEFACDHEHGVVVDDEGTQRPVEAGSQDLRSWWCRGSGVLTPYAAAFDAFVPAEANVKRGGPVAEGFVGEAVHDGIPDDPCPPHRRHQSSAVLGWHSRMGVCPVIYCPRQVRSRASSRLNVMRAEGEKVDLHTSRAFGWTV